MTNIESNLNKNHYLHKLIFILINVYIFILNNNIFTDRNNMKIYFIFKDKLYDFNKKY